VPSKGANAFGSRNQQMTGRQLRTSLAVRLSISVATGLVTPINDICRRTPAPDGLVFTIWPDESRYRKVAVTFLATARTCG
jgi:hypothetical protein